MQIMTVFNRKGGVGKTATAVNLAAAIGKRKRVLLVDLDPQASASCWLGHEGGAPGLFEVLAGDSKRVPILPGVVAGVDLVPAYKRLELADSTLNLSQAIKHLRRAIDAIAGDYSAVLIDSPPSIGMLSVAALGASDGVLAPVEASRFGLSGCLDVERAIEGVSGVTGRALKLVGILPCRLTRSNHTDAVLSALRARYGRKVFKAEIRETVRVREAAVECVPVIDYAPNSTAATDYRRAASELLKRMK